MKVQRDYYRLSNRTFLIYLVYAGIIDMIFVLMSDRLFGSSLAKAVAVVIIYVIAFVFLFLFAEVYGRFGNKFWTGKRKG